MVHATSATAARDLAYSDLGTLKPIKARALFRRLLDALIAARQQEVERAIGRYIRNNGGKLTDSLEREIEHRFLSTL